MEVQYLPEPHNTCLVGTAALPCSAQEENSRAAPSSIWFCLTQGGFLGLVVLRGKGRDRERADVCLKGSNKNPCWGFLMYRRGLVLVLFGIVSSRSLSRRALGDTDEAVTARLPRYLWVTAAADFTNHTSHFHCNISTITPCDDDDAALQSPAHSCASNVKRSLDSLIVDHFSVSNNVK